MNDKVCLITGATSGIGKETALALAIMGYTVVLTSRNQIAGTAIKEELIAASNNPRIEVLECDLSSLAAVRELAVRFKARYDRLDVLMNNAALWQPVRKLSKEGIELTWVTNYLSPYLLTRELMDVLKAAPNARIINVASALYHVGKLNWDDLEGAQQYVGYRAYAQSKLALVLHTRTLAAQLAGTHVTVNAVHPGLVRTNIARNSGNFFQFFVSFFGISSRQGAETQIYLATSPDLEGVTGGYFERKKRQKLNAAALDDTAAEKLVAVTEAYLAK